jgi:hypothetical protein
LQKEINVSQEIKTIAYINEKKELVIFNMAGDTALPATQNKNGNSGIDNKYLGEIAECKEFKRFNLDPLITPGRLDAAGMAARFIDGYFQKFDIENLKIIFDSKIPDCSYFSICVNTWGAECTDTKKLISGLESLKIEGLSVKVADFALKIPEVVLGTPIETEKKIAK